MIHDRIATPHDERPSIRKAARIVGKNLVFRDATVGDAAFILGLRTDPDKGRYLTKTDSDLGKQTEWLQRYATLTDQAYFIIETQDGRAVGTVRLYDQQDDSFCWGSWIKSDEAPAHFGIESALIVYRYAMDFLGFKNAHFDVRIGNTSVWQFHERFGARRVRETGDDYYYVLDEKAIRIVFEKYSRYLPQPIVVTYPA